MPFSDLPSQPSTKADPLVPTNQSDAMPVSLIKRVVSVAPWYYRFIISVLKPLYYLQVWRRSHKRDNYQQEVAQRFGKYYPPRPVVNVSTDVNTTDFAHFIINHANVKNNSIENHGIKNNRIKNPHIKNHDIKNKVIWCHAVSLGETNTIAPLLDALLQRGYQIWLTNTTQTGFARGASRFAEAIAQGRLSHSYVPVDSPPVIETFLAHVQPVIALFVETELWANILTILSQHHIPSVLVNGRLSAASFSRYQKIGAVSGSMMQNLTLIIAQDNESAERFQQLGAYRAQIRVAGSLKWVVNSSKTMNTHDLNAMTSKQKSAIETESGIDLEPLDRPIWVAASTHSGEEAIALSLQQQILSLPALAKTLLIIVPRHPERFDEVATIVQSTGLQMVRRSTEEIISAQTQVYLADSMGELMQWYELADVALVGGSLVDIGGHNPVEPASVATPVLMGRYTQSCQSVVDKLAGVGALYQPNNDCYRPIAVDGQLAEHDNAEVMQQAFFKPPATDDTRLIYQQLQFWLNHPQIAKLAGQAGEQLTLRQQSVLTRQLMMIEEVIDKFTNRKR